MIDISKLDKADVLTALYNNSRPLGLGFLHATPGDMTRAEAQGYLDEYTYFNYLKGRVMKVELGGDELDPRLYDRDNGRGAAQAALSHLLKETQSILSSEEYIEKGSVEEKIIES